MKSLKLGNWKLALFALGACVVATPVILSSCGSTIGSGNFVGYDNNIVMNEGPDYCSSKNFSIDGNNITHYPNYSYTYNGQTDYSYDGWLTFKFDREYKEGILVNGKESGWPTDENTEVSVEAISYLLYVSDKYISVDDAKNCDNEPASPWDNYNQFDQARYDAYWAWKDSLPKTLASAHIYNGHYINDDVKPNYSQIYDFSNADDSEIVVNSAITMYITLLKITRKTKSNVSDINYLTYDMYDHPNKYDSSYSVYNVTKFTYKRDNSKIVGF